MEWFQSGINLISKGGIIMIPILICSIIALAIVIERLIEMKRLGDDGEMVSANVKKLLEHGNDKKALEICNQTQGPIGQIFKAGLLNRKNPRWKLEEKLSLVGQETIAEVGEEYQRA